MTQEYMYNIFMVTSMYDNSLQMREETHHLKQLTFARSGLSCPFLQSLGVVSWSKRTLINHWLKLNEIWQAPS